MCIGEQGFYIPCSVFSSLQFWNNRAPLFPLPSVILVGTSWTDFYCVFSNVLIFFRNFLEDSQNTSHPFLFRLGVNFIGVLSFIFLVWGVIVHLRQLVFSDLVVLTASVVLGLRYLFKSLEIPETSLVI